MIVVRPIRHNDYPTLHVCAKESGHGFTSLPVDEALLNERIEHSVASFTKPVTEPDGEGYLMVGVDSETGEMAGTTAIEASIGGDVPVYSYHISKIIHSSQKLGIKNVVRLLTLSNHYAGCSEICTLFLRPAYRQGMNGKLMSKCRFLLMAEHPQRFSPTVIAEMRGISDEHGKSPFWKWLQDAFFHIEFTHADHLMGIRDKSFITELMPKLPIYTNLLSREAQAVIGKVHKYTVPALKMLQKEGFVCRDYVDIFDAGPTVECDLHNINSVKHSLRATVAIGQVGNSDFLISNTSFADFRAVATKAWYDAESNTLFVNQETLAALEIHQGDPVRLLPM